MAARVDLVDPGPEGASLAGGLRAAGFEVELRPLVEVPRTVADAVVLAGDAEGALDAIRRLRDDGASPDTPVVLLGTPPGTSHRGSGPGFGAQAVLARPVALGALIDTLEHVLAPPHSVVSPSRHPPRRERTIQLDAERATSSSEPGAPEASASQGVSEAGLSASSEVRRFVRATPPPETGADPLRDLHDLGEPIGRTPAPHTPAERTSSSGALATTAPVASSGVLASGALGGAGSPGASSSSGAVRASASISEHLRELLRAADRRAFPGRPPIDVSLPGGDEPASVLVPAELLEHDDLAIDVAPDDDPIDAFTFVGGPVLPASLGAEGASPEPAAVHELAPGIRDRLRPSSRPPSELPPHKKTHPGTPTSLSRRPAPRSQRPPELPVEHEPGWTGIQEARVRPPSAPAPRMPSEWPAEDSVLGRVTPDGGRRGTLAVGGALRLLMRIVELRLDARIAITPAQGETVTLVAVAGELTALEGPEATRAVALLRRRDRSIATALDEAAARRALEDAVARGSLTELERDRALREAREQLLRELASATRAAFSLARYEGDAAPARTASPLGAPLVVAIAEAARRAISTEHARAILGGSVELRRGPRFDDLAADGVIAPEIAALLARHDGESDARVLDEAADEPGMPGLICALVAARALLATPIAPPDPAPRERARAARRLIEEAARLAEEGDYFAVLGVAHDASDRDVHHTHRRRVDGLAALPLDELGLAGLAGDRQAALDALDEAHRILSVPRWRRAYAAALAPHPPPGALSPGPVTSAAEGAPGEDAHAPQLAGPTLEH